MKAINFTMCLINLLLTVLMTGLFIVMKLFDDDLINDMKLLDTVKLSEFITYSIHIVM